MKKKIIAAIVALALVGVALVQVIPAMAQANQLDHVVISPSNTVLGVDGVQQFTAQAYNNGNQPISNVTYFWLVTAGGGTITSTGLFTAGSALGTFPSTVEVVAVQNSVTTVAMASVTVTPAGTAGPLATVVVTPGNATVASGGTQQFTAQGYDASGVAIPGLAYTWNVVAGGGTIGNTTGVFVAGTTTGTFTNTVQATVNLNGTLTVGTATVVVSTSPTAGTATTTAANLNISSLLRAFTGYLNKAGFSSFLGGQWQMKDSAGNTETVNVVPGVVTSYTAGSSLTITPNNPTSQSIFTLSSGTAIVPTGTAVASGDKVMVVTVTDTQGTEVIAVAEVGATVSTRMPPGLEKHGNEREGKQTPPGWSHGKKMGWQRSGSDAGND